MSYTLEKDEQREVLEELDQIIQVQDFQKLLDVARQTSKDQKKTENVVEVNTTTIKILIILYVYNLRTEDLKAIYQRENQIKCPPKLLFPHKLSCPTCFFYKGRKISPTNSSIKKTNHDYRNNSFYYCYKNRSNDIKKYLKDIELDIPKEKILRENLGFNIKIILNELEILLYQKGYQIKYREKNRPVLEKINNDRNKRYETIGCHIVTFYLIGVIGTFISIKYFSQNDFTSFLILAGQFLLSISFAGFFGYIHFSEKSNNININEKRKILQYIKKSVKEYQANDEDKKSTSPIKTVYSTSEAYLDLSGVVKKLISQLNNQDEVSKLLHRKSKRLNATNDKIYLIKNNEVIKTSKLHYVSNFFYELIDYSTKSTAKNASNTIEETLNTLLKNRQLLREIESIILLNRAKKILWFVSFPMVIYFISNFCIVIAAIFGEMNHFYQPIGFIPIPKFYLNIGFLLLSSLAVLIFPTGYLCYAYFKYFSVMTWRENISRIEEAIAGFFELFAFFFGSMLVILVCFGVVSFLEYPLFAITNNERIFFYTTISAFFPLEFFDISNYSLLLNNENNQILKFIVRSLVITLSTIFSLKIVSLLVNKYRKYSYDEHSYNAFLPPELLKIFGYFSVFIFSSALAYSLIIVEFKDEKTQETNQKKQLILEPDSKGSINISFDTNGSDTPSFTFTDFLPYSIFITLIGAGFAIATRDLLENYFSGVAQRVDAPFEEGDMVTIDDSSIMQVKTIGFKNVSFYDINKNAIRHIPFKSLDKQKIINFTDPTLHYRRSIYLFVSVKNKLSKDKSIISNLSITKRAEMLLLLAAFYVEGVKVPRKYPLKSQDIEKLLKDTEFINRIKQCKNISSFYQEVENSIKSMIEKNQEVEFDDNKYLFLKYYKESNISTKLFKEHEDHLQETVSELQEKIAIAKLTEKVISEINSGNIQLALYDGFKVKRNSFRLTQYHSLLIESANLAVKVSYLYYQLALSLWELKEEQTISKHEKRNIDEVSLELLNAPRVSSRNIIDSSGTARWEMDLEVTLQLAEQSDEIIHHINSFVDEHYQLFIGSHNDNEKDAKKIWK